MSDDLRVNKYAAAILVTALVGIAAHEVSNSLFQAETPEKPGYLIEVEENHAELPKEEAPQNKLNLAEALATADLQAGAKISRKCSACHDFVADGSIKQGPPLWNVVGRDVASYQGFQYSEALSGKEGKWDYQTLDNYLERPSRAVPGTAMNFIGLRKAKDRVNLLAWLRSRADQPYPLP